MSDAVDIINMSLGSFYGQPESADTLAVSNAVRVGVVVAVAAGNDGDRPWIVGQPSIAPAALAVAETALPDAALQPIQVLSPTIAGLPDNTVKYALPQTWAPVPTAPVSGVAHRPERSGRALGRAGQPGLRRQQLRQLRPVRAADRAPRPRHVRRHVEGGQRRHRRRAGGGARQ